MTPRFGDAALRLCGLAARLLGWRPDEFWAATPAELATSLTPPENNAAPLDRAGLAALMEQDNG